MIADQYPEFRVHDVWRVPIVASSARGEDFDMFFDVFLQNGLSMDSRVADWLFRFRFRLGAAFGWDDPEKSLPSVASGGTPIEGLPVPATIVWRREEEALVEIVNETVQALLHFAWVDADEPRCKSPELTILVKSTGMMTPVYLAAIGPFRHTIIYPAWFRSLLKQWTAEQELRADD